MIHPYICKLVIVKYLFCLCFAITFSALFATVALASEPAGSFVNDSADGRCSDQVFPTGRITAAKSARIEKARRYLEDQGEHKGFSGSVLVAEHGSVVLEAGLGCANYEWDIPNKSSTRFKIGSITKGFTATAVLFLASQRKLSLDDKVCRWIDACPVAWRDIMVHQLLDHSSGIPDIVRLPGFSERITRSTTLDDTVDLLRKLPLIHRPGVTAEYGNSGAIVAAKIIERITGQPYDIAIDSLVNAPLHLQHSGYAWNARIIPDLASGYVRSGKDLLNAPFIDMSVPMGAGSQYSNVQDLLHWQLALTTTDFLPRNLVASMFDTRPFGYGYGWIDYSSDTRRVVGHIGDINGFGSFIGVYGNSDRTIIVLSNVEKTNVHAIADMLDELLAEN